MISFRTARAQQRMIGSQHSHTIRGCGVYNGCGLTESFTTLTGDLTFHSCEVGHTGVYTMVAENTSGQVKRDVSLSVLVAGEESTTDMGGVEKEELPVVPIEDFGSYVQTLHSHNNQLLREQYKVWRV